jgi:hypothetical protein
MGVGLATSGGENMMERVLGGSSFGDLLSGNISSIAATVESSSTLWKELDKSTGETKIRGCESAIISVTCSDGTTMLKCAVLFYKPQHFEKKDIILSAFTAKAHHNSNPIPLRQRNCQAAK